MPSPSSANLEAAALLVLNTPTTTKSKNDGTDIDEEGWQVVVPKARNKRSTTSVMPAGSPRAQDANANTNKKIGGKKKVGGGGGGGIDDGLKGSKLHSAKGVIRRSLGASLQPFTTASKILPSLTFKQAITIQEPQESILENNIVGNRDSAQLTLAPVVQATQIDYQTIGSRASFSDKEVVDLTSPQVSLSQSSVPIPDEEFPHERVLVDSLEVALERTPLEAIVPIETLVPIEDEDHKNGAVKLTQTSSLPSLSEARLEAEQTRIESIATFSHYSLLPRWREITVTDSLVPVAYDNHVDYGMWREPRGQPINVYNAFEGGIKGIADGTLRRLSPPFHWSHGVVPFEVLPPVTTWAVTVTPFMHGGSVDPHVHSFPHVVVEPIHQGGTPMTTMGAQSKLNPYAQEFLPSYIKDQSSTFGVMAVQHRTQASSTNTTVVGAHLSSRGGQMVDTMQSASRANNNNYNGNKGQVGKQMQGMQRRRNRYRGGYGEGPSDRSFGDFFSNL